MNYLSGAYLLSPAAPQFRFVWPAVLFFLTMAMLSTTLAYLVEQQNYKRAPITRKVGQIRTWAWSIAIVGLVLIGFRVGGAAIPWIESRLLLYLVALCYLGLAGYLAYFLRYVLPKKNEAYEATRLRRQYQPRRRR